MAPYNSIFIRGVFTFGRRFLGNRNTSPTLRADRLKNEKRGSKSRVTREAWETTKLHTGRKYPSDVLQHHASRAIYGLLRFFKSIVFASFVHLIIRVAKGRNN